MWLHKKFISQRVYCDVLGSKSSPSKQEPPRSMFDVIEKSASIGAFDKAVNVLSEPGTYYGFTAGACTGFALKKVAKAAAFTFGAVFMGFQLASQTGYVTVNWPKVEGDLKKYFPDRPTDESQMVSEAVKFLTTNTGIAATVFTAGFVTGLKMG